MDEASAYGRPARSLPGDNKVEKPTQTAPMKMGASFNKSKPKFTKPDKSSSLKLNEAEMQDIREGVAGSILKSVTGHMGMQIAKGIGGPGLYRAISHGIKSHNKAQAMKAKGMPKQSTMTPDKWKSGQGRDLTGSANQPRKLKEAEQLRKALSEK